ncbi:MAG TPA: HAMP domain-containing sensor histidine kinase [Candidatus Paceibacterota bacterium]|nr:HAMP domain-containing sensor histidine kinase [Candidatus Paceibacterota bacterium]
MAPKKTKTSPKENGAENILRQERVKADFIADATHEFRTPLAIIKGNIDLALQIEDPTGAAAKKALRAINKEVMHLAHLLSDLTVLTMHGNEFQNNLVFERVDVADIIKDMMHRCQALVLTNDRKITVKIIGKIPSIIVWGHALYLEKLFLNVINNGITYSKQNGTVALSAKIVKNNAVITIKDNGIGIVKKSLPHIFERFYRIDKTRASQHGVGIGLGLPISRWITKIHGGEITADSKGADKGSTFVITLPLMKESK